MSENRKPMQVTLDPAEIRSRLADAVQEADTLRRLLKIAERNERNRREREVSSAS
jgi:hypothetical protein